MSPDIYQSDNQIFACSVSLNWFLSLSLSLSLSLIFLTSRSTPSNDTPLFNAVRSACASKSSALGAMHMDLVSISLTKLVFNHHFYALISFFALSFQPNLRARKKRKKKKKKKSTLSSPFPSSSSPPLALLPLCSPPSHSFAHSFLHSFIPQQGFSSACRYCPHCRGRLMSRFVLRAALSRGLGSGHCALTGSL
ncbi:hypothetical protein LI328DRAFT_121681 [Trichoderma asperelloides]|nr:hypothetical protein LI328DRAFT_121681 [Trichoderma asperelloides]